MLFVIDTPDIYVINPTSPDSPDSPDNPGNPSLEGVSQGHCHRLKWSVRVINMAMLR